MGAQVTAAIDHFTAHPSDVRAVKIWSERQKRWYMNSLANLAKFDPIPEVVQDGTEEFEGKVTDAIDYFAAHPNDRRLLKIYSRRENRWYKNSAAHPAEFKPMP